jgi:hypothetical protein
MTVLPREQKVSAQQQQVSESVAAAVQFFSATHGIHPSCRKGCTRTWSRPAASTGPAPRHRPLLSSPETPVPVYSLDPRAQDVRRVLTPTSDTTAAHGHRLTQQPLPRGGSRPIGQFPRRQCASFSWNWPCGGSLPLTETTCPMHPTGASVVVGRRLPEGSYCTRILRLYVVLSTRPYAVQLYALLLCWWAMNSPVLLLLLAAATCL